MLFKALTSMAASRRPPPPKKKKQQQPTNRLTKQNKTKQNKNHQVASGESNTNSLEFREVEKNKKTSFIFHNPKSARAQPFSLFLIVFDIFLLFYNN